MKACSCNEDGHRGSKTERLQSISIHTLFDFDEDHLANSDVTDLFKLHGSQSTLNESISRSRDDLVFYPYLRLELIDRPSLEDKIQFLIRLELSDNEVYEVETSTVEFFE